MQPNLLPSFGVLHDVEENSVSPKIHQKLVTHEQKSFTKKMCTQMGNLIRGKDVILQNSKADVANVISFNTPVSIAPRQNVRRSSRLFSSGSYSVKENNKSVNSNKIVSPRSPSRKTKQQRLAKTNLNELNAFNDINARNNMKKEKSETVTSDDNVRQPRKNNLEMLMHLMRDMGQAYCYLSQYDCKAAIAALNELPPHHHQTTWVNSMLGLAYFEMADYENCVKYFSDMHKKEPHMLKYMDIYSSGLWHLQNEVALSALAQDMINTDRNSPVTWIVNGNCFSLHKEHDTAIKFLHRAVQVDPSFPYAYTLLGHEYIMTEELDKAMNCYRNAIRLDSRHYNAWFGMGTIFSKQERFHLAEIHFSKSLSINRFNSTIMCHVGIVQQALKKTDKALATYNAAINNDPKNPLCKFHRGSLYFNIGKFTEALQELEELKDIVPKESLVYYLIGKVHKKLGNTDLALMHFSWATDLDPKGASSQIKEAFDPAVGRSADVEPLASSSIEESLSMNDSNQQQQQRPREQIDFTNVQEDSEDSL